MSEAKFTKGEWYVSNGIFVGVKGEGDDAIVSGVGLLSDAKANAHLISSAPEMYRTIETILSVLSGKTEFSADEIDLIAIERLLAKARGES